MKKLLLQSKFWLSILIFCGCFVYFHHQSRQIDYSKLETLLQEKKWLEADIETTNIVDKIFLVMVDDQNYWGYSRIDLFRTERIRNINRYDCHYFIRLDSLWQKYSNNKYGFTTQSRILWSLKKSEKEQLKHDKRYSVLSDFYQKVGWSDHEDDPNYERIEGREGIDLQKEGSLPSFYYIHENMPKSISTLSFLQRFHTCHKENN